MKAISCNIRINRSNESHYQGCRRINTLTLDVAPAVTQEAGSN